MNSAVAFGMFPDIEEERYQNALLAGIPLFQLVWPKKAYFGELISGPFNVDVKSRDLSSGSSLTNQRRGQFMVNWRTGGDANVMFDLIGKGGKKIAMAWMPDDFAWHNRLILMDSPSILNMVSQLRLPNNDIKSGKEIQFEISCLEEVLKEPMEVWEVYGNGKYIETYKNKTDAEEWIKEENKIDEKDKKRKKIKFIATPKKILDYKSEVKELIKKEKNLHKFGWSECSKFREVYMPKTIELINSKKKEVIKTPSLDLDSISEADLARLRAKLGMTAPAATVGQVQNQRK